MAQPPTQASATQAEASHLDALAEIEREVLWLSTAIVHHANRVRPNPAGLKVGGHQASSASMVTIMTALWFGHLTAADRVSVKPHASPVLHAINYLLGELDEGAVWETIADPGLAELGEIVWIVDMNRQSLDRVVPGIAAGRLAGMFAAAGWQVITLKYGRLLEHLFAQPSGGPELRHRIDAMPNPEYQRLLRCPPDELRRRLPADSEPIKGLINKLDDETLTQAIRNLAGHDLRSLDDAFNAIDDTRPTVILAYTIKGYGLPIEGPPRTTPPC